MPWKCIENFLGALEVEKVGQKWVVAHFFERKVQVA